MTKTKPRMLIALALGVAFALLVAIPALAGATSNTTANLHDENGSGITGTFKFRDNGDTLGIDGKASGLNPDKAYISLIYDNASVDTGPFSCEPAIFDPGDPDYILETMFVGLWDVNPNGTGSLKTTNIIGDDSFIVYVPTDKFHTISIREFGGDLVACGIEG